MSENTQSTETDENYEFIGPLKIVNDYLWGLKYSIEAWSCKRCGAIVVDAPQHNRFHNSVAMPLFGGLL